jgi:hypothetical protein
LSIVFPKNPLRPFNPGRKIPGYARDVNNESLNYFKPKFATNQQRAQMWGITMTQKNHYFRCSICGSYMVGDLNVLQDHMSKVHIRDRRNKKEKKIKFTPETQHAYGAPMQTVLEKKYGVRI